jgi:hypothetical protein
MLGRMNDLGEALVAVVLGVALDCVDGGVLSIVEQETGSRAKANVTGCVESGARAAYRRACADAGILRVNFGQAPDMRVALLHGPFIRGGGMTELLRCSRLGWRSRRLPAIPKGRHVFPGIAVVLLLAGCGSSSSSQSASRSRTAIPPSPPTGSWTSSTPVDSGPFSQLV